MAPGNFFLDTNIWIRYLTESKHSRYKAVFALLQKIQNAEIHVLFSGIIALEIYYITTRIYNWTKEDVTAFISDILSLPSITLIEETNTLLALKLVQTYNMKFADALILSQLPEEAVLVSYDKDFSGIPDIQRLTPEDIV